MATPLSRLTTREYEIACLYAGGSTYTVIARQLSIAPATVRNHIAGVYRKLAIGDKHALARLLSDADDATRPDPEQLN